ncbi:MAG: hypothetical protein IT460_15755 [Planctomycetes bacterium]|nr:hypothetical protein [Planctomycetota bacterium]
MTDASAPEHDAPPAYRPVSGGAVTALVLAIVLALAALSGFWWSEALALVVAALSWRSIASGRRRGAGIAITAAVIALAAGLYAFVAHRAIAATFEKSFDGLLTALAQDDRAALRPWAAKGEDADVAAQRWKKAYDRVAAEAGPYGGRVDVHATWVGALAAIFAPPGAAIVDVVNAESPPPDPLTAVWFEAAFQRERVWVALEAPPTSAAPQQTSEALQDAVRASPDHPTPAIVKEVRFFRAKPR